MVEYIENKPNLGDNNGREMAIEFARSMNNYEKRIDLKNSVVSDLFDILRNNSLKTFDGDIIENTIIALLEMYEGLNFRKGSGMGYFTGDINSNLGYIYSFYPSEL